MLWTAFLPQVTRDTKAAPRVTTGKPPRQADLSNCADQLCPSHDLDRHRPPSAPVDTIGNEGKRLPVFDAKAAVRIKGNSPLLD
jgi:hypothetical protein